MIGLPLLVLSLYKGESFGAVLDATARCHRTHVRSRSINFAVPWIVDLHALRVCLHFSLWRSLFIVLRDYKSFESDKDQV